MTNVTHNNSVTDMGTRTNTNVQGNNIVVNLISEAQALYSRLVDAVQVINEMDVTAMNSQQSSLIPYMHDVIDDIGSTLLR